MRISDNRSRQYPGTCRDMKKKKRKRLLTVRSVRVSGCRFRPETKNPPIFTMRQSLPLAHVVWVQPTKLFPAGLTRGLWVMDDRPNGCNSSQGVRGNIIIDFFFFSLSLFKLRPALFSLYFPPSFFPFFFFFLHTLIFSLGVKGKKQKEKNWKV